MRLGNAQFEAHRQAGKPLALTDLYEITTVDGTVMRWTGGEVPCAWNGVPYLLGPKIVRGDLKKTAGLQVDTLDLRFYPDTTNFKVATPSSGPVPIIPDPVINGVPLRKAMLRGDFDGAHIKMSRGYAARPLQYIGSVQQGEALSLAIAGQDLTIANNLLVLTSTLESNWTFLDVFPAFVGRLGMLTGGGVEIHTQARSILSLLDQMVPGNVYQPSCDNLLFDSICGLNAASYKVSAAVTSISGQLAFTAIALGQAADYFRLGQVLFKTGENKGRRYGVQSHGVGGAIALNRQPVAPLVIGDTFDIWPGCDKKQATCTTKYGNLRRFRGMPYIPAPETTL